MSGDDPAEYLSDVFGKITQNYEEFKNHTHPNENEPSQNVQSGNISQEHIGTRPIIFSCEECDFIFTDREKLDAHLSQNRESEIECDVCGRYFVDHAELLKHKKTKHGEMETFLKDLLQNPEQNQ